MSLMKRSSLNKLLSVIGCMVLLAAMVLNLTGCGSKSTADTSAANQQTTSFTFEVVDLDGNKESFTVTTGKTIVGEALMEEGLIQGEDGQYSLYVNTVNGITADWDKDQTYWTFYINGEYAVTGVDVTETDPTASYSMVLTKG